MSSGKTETKKIHKIFPFLSWLPEVNGGTIKADIIAGITGAIIVLPQGVAFAMIAGLPPIYGLYTAIVVPIVAALFGSSRHLISGPTTAISLVVFAALSPISEPGSIDYIQLALLLTLMAGIFQFAMGLARFGILVNFVSHTVVIGFTAGAAILIAVSQLKHVFGVTVSRGTFFNSIAELISKLGDINFYALSIAGVTLLVAILSKKISKKLPHLLLAMIVGSLVNYFFFASAQGVTTIGEINFTLPAFGVPDLSVGNLRLLSSNAFAIALLGLIEAVAIARSIGLKSGQRIDGNQEFIGQGLSNIVGSFFHCYAGSGSFTRSGVNYDSGARTPLAALFAAVFLVIILIFVAPFAAYLPIPAMGGVILLVAWNLIDFKHIKDIVLTSRRESIVLLLTLFSTLFLELEFAIYIGVIFSLVFYLQETSKPRVVAVAPNVKQPARKLINVRRHLHIKECPQIKIIRIDGGLFFGSVDHIENEINKFTEGAEPFVLIVLSGVNLMDLAGAEMLVRVKERLLAQGRELYLSNIKRKARKYLLKGHFLDVLNSEHIFPEDDEAIEFIFQKLDKNICADCSVRCFKPCQSL